MKVYKIFDKVSGKYADHTWGGWGGLFKANYDDIVSATRATPHSNIEKENCEVHGFELTLVSKRTNQGGGKWNAEVSIDSKD